MARYIDADGLIKIKFHPLPYQYVVPSDVDKESYVRGWNDVIDGIIETMPTANVVERKRGKWIQRSDTPWYYYCSNCHRVISAASVDQIEKFHAFCGTCGADMREENDE